MSPRIPLEPILSSINALMTWCLVGYLTPHLLLLRNLLTKLQPKGAEDFKCPWNHVHVQVQWCIGIVLLGVDVAGSFHMRLELQPYGALTLIPYWLFSDKGLGR